MRILADFAFLILAIIFLVGWLVAWAAFHIAGGFVHLLIVIAVLALILHFARGRRTAI